MSHPSGVWHLMQAGTDRRQLRDDVNCRLLRGGEALDGPKASVMISDLSMASAADQTIEDPGQGSIWPDLAQTLSAP